MLGDKINEFDNSKGTVEDFNRIFDRTPLNLQNSQTVEILGICFGDTFKRYILIDEKDETTHCFNCYANILSEEKAQEINSDNFYVVKKNGVIVFKAFTMEELAKKMKVGIIFIDKRLKKIPIREKKLRKKFKDMVFEKIIQ